MHMNAFIPVYFLLLHRSVSSLVLMSWYSDCIVLFILKSDTIFSFFLLMIALAIQNFLWVQMFCDWFF